MDFPSLSFASLGFLFCLVASSAVASGPSPQARWAVTDPATGNRCVLATFGASFLIEYDFTDPANQTSLRNATLPIPTAGVSVDNNASFCNGGTLGTYNQLKLKWTNFGYPYALALVFGTIVNNFTSVSQIFLEYSLDHSSVFPAAVEGGSRIAQYVGPSPVEVIPPRSYLKCDRGFPVPEMTESTDETTVSGIMYDVKLEAFRVSKTDTFDDDMSVCPGDMMTTTRAPATTTTTTPHPETTTTPFPGVTTTAVVVPPVINVVVNVNVSVIGNANGNGNVNSSSRNGSGVSLAFVISTLWFASAAKRH